ncbi:MAG: LCP family protein [Candidatus Pacebacteria bacterium]|nr:LCP family protein [Candidatus Paceibacterota bacterium]
MSKQKFIIKTIIVLVLITASIAVIFSFQIFSASQKIFSQNEEIHFVKQFGDLILHPTKSIKGEEADRINILLLGMGGENHNGGELTDTVMIASIKPSENEAALLSIPRDLYVNIPETNFNTKINAIKLFGDKSKDKNGMELLSSVVENVSGLEIHYFVQLDFQGFIKVIDDLNGIDVYLENDISDPNYPNFNNGYDPFYIEKGFHHLDGSTALKVARSRHSKMGDFDRIVRQQTIIKATKQKIFEKYESYDVILFNKMLSSLSDNLRTNLRLKELPRFYQITKEIKSHKITADVIDTQKYLNRTYVGMGYTLQAKDDSYEKIKQLSADMFNLEISEERKELIETESANIEIQNGTDSLDLANKVAFDLEEFGYRIINSTNISEPDFSGVMIYDNSKNEKPNTLDFLKEKFNAIIEESISDNFEKADFVIVLGKGF